MEWGQSWMGRRRRWCWICGARTSLGKTRGAPWFPSLSSHCGRRTELSLCRSILPPPPSYSCDRSPPSPTPASPLSPTLASSAPLPPPTLSPPPQPRTRRRTVTRAASSATGKTTSTSTKKGKTPAKRFLHAGKGQKVGGGGGLDGREVRFCLHSSDFCCHSSSTSSPSSLSHSLSSPHDLDERRRRTQAIERRLAAEKKEKEEVIDLCSEEE